MNGRQHRISDAGIDEVIGLLLQVGVVVSTLIVLVGGGLYMTRHGVEAPNYHIFHGEPSDLSSIKGIVRDAFTFSARGVIQLGLLLLIATPVMRVAFAAVSFMVQGDKVYVGVTLIVLTVLIFSIVGDGP